MSTIEWLIILLSMSSSLEIKFIMLSCILLFCLLSFSSFSDMELSMTLTFDLFSCAMIILTVAISGLMIMSWGKNHMKKHSKNLSSLTLMSTLVLILCFNVNSPFIFYLLFELSLVPIMIMVFGWGGQPERMKATQFLVIYTIFSSFFLLFLILTNIQNFKEMYSFSLKSLILFNFNSQSNNLFFFSLIVCFLVKFPMFGLHLWLPKAHVEAPVLGSMLLAAILLKLGGYGLIRFSVLLENSWQFLEWLKIFSIFGGAAVGIFCLTLKDMKVLIAYSSVSHMAMVIYACLMKNITSFYGAMILMLAHGMVSSGLFAMANVSYERSHTRSMLLNMGITTLLPILTLFWFMLCLGNMGGPPSLNLFGEIILICNILKNNFLNFIPIFFMTFMAVAYSLILYIVPSQSQMSENPITSNPLNYREMDLLSYHVFITNLSILLLYLMF